MALGLSATLGLVLGYLEGCPDPLEVAESTPYAAWRSLCMHVCSEPSTAADVLSIIISERPAVKGVRCCPAHQLVAELVLALDDPSALATAAVFWPVLATAACGLLNSPKGTTQSAQAQLGAKMLAALVTSSSVFTEYAAQRPALTAALGTALYASKEDGPEVRAAVSALISKILETSPAAKGAFLACVSRLLSGRDSSGQQKPGHPTTMADLLGRPHGVSVLEVLLSLPGFSMSSTAASELQRTAMQDVLGLLQDVYATHSSAPAPPAAVTSAGTSSGTQGRMLRLKLSGKAPAPAASASPAQPAAIPEPTAAAGQPDAAAGGSAQQAPHAPLQPAPAAAAPDPEPTAAAPPDAAAGGSAQPPQHAPLQPAPAEAAPGPDPITAAVAAPPDAAAGGSAQQPRPAPPQPAPAALGPDPTKAAAAAPPDAAAGGPAQPPLPARAKPLPLALLQLVLRTLAKLTEVQPQHMAQEMTLPVLNALLSLLDPSMQHLACKAYAAAIVMDSLSWACVTARNTAPAESLIGLFISVKHVSILEAIHLLEHSCEFTTKEGKQRSFALLQAVTVLANRLVPMGAGSMAGPGAAAAGAASKGQQGRAVVARRLAKVPGLLPMLREMVQTVDRASAGDTAPAMDLLFPHYSQHHQDRIAWIPEFLERHQYVTFLSELLEHPSTDPAHAGQVAIVAHLLLQCARTAPVRTLRASQLQKAPRSRGPGAQAAQTAQAADQQDDKVSVVLCALVAAIQPRSPPLSASSSSSRWAELSQAAVHAAEALSILAGQPLGASELARPAALERLLQVLEAAGRPGSWEDVQSLQDSAGKSGDSTGSGLTEASAQYRAALSRVPGIICQAAVLEPSLAPKLEQASPKAACLLAAALRLHHPGADLDSPVGGQVLPAAAVGLAKAWPALAGFLKPPPGWQEWQGSPDIHDHLQPGQEQQAQQPQQQHQLVLKGLNRQCFAHEPADLSLCTWGAALSPQDAPELDDTCSSQPRQQGADSARACDRMSLDGGSSCQRMSLDGSSSCQRMSLETEATADCVVFVVPVGATKAKAVANAAEAAEMDSDEPLSPPSSPLKRKLQLTDDAATAAATTAAEQQQQQHEGSPAKVRALAAGAGTEREGSPAQRSLAFGAAAAGGAHQEQQKQPQAHGAACQQQQQPRSSGAACQHPGEASDSESVLIDVGEALIDLHSTQQQLNNLQHGAQGGDNLSEEPARWWSQWQAQLVRALSGDLEGQGRVGLQAGQPPQPPPQQQQRETERDAQQKDGGRTAKQASAEPVIAAKAHEGHQQQAQKQQAQQQQQEVEGEDVDLTELVDGSDSGTSSDDDADSGSSGVVVAGSGTTTGSGSAAGSNSGSRGGSKGWQRCDRRGGANLHSLRAAAAAPGVQALLGSLGFGQPGGSTDSPAKEMLTESVKDGKIVFVPQKKLKVLPVQHRQAAKESGHVVAARMWKKGQRAAGEVWGYGWGRDMAAAEQAAAEAAVAHMYVCGVLFAGLPPYTGPGPV